VFLDGNKYQRLDYFSAYQHRSPGVDGRVCLPLNNPLKIPELANAMSLGNFGTTYIN
jgi:hypothetical protein